MRSLSIEHGVHDPSGFVFLSALTKLTDLWISGSYRDGDLDRLSALTKVERLSINCPKLTPAGFSAFASWRKLVQVTIEAKSLRGPGLHVFGDSRARLCLQLHHCRLDDAAVLDLGRSPGIRELDLGLTKLPRANLDAIAKIPGLRCLALGVDMKFDDADLEALAPAHELRELRLSRGKTTREGLATLWQLPALRRLEVGSEVLERPRKSTSSPNAQPERPRKRQPRAEPKRPSTTVRSFYVLCVGGSPGHVHYGSLFVHGRWTSVRRELRTLLERELVESDLWPGKELDVAVFDDGELRRSVDLIPLLRVHEVKARRALGRPHKLTTLLDDPAQSERVQAALREGTASYALRLRWSDLHLPSRLSNAIRDGESVRVPRWTETEDLGLDDWVVRNGWTSTLDG